MATASEIDAWRKTAEEGLHTLKELLDAAPSGGIVVMQSAGLGDSLHMSVVVHQLRRDNPDRWIGWATGKAYLCLHHRNPHANKVVGLPKPPVCPGTSAGLAIRGTWAEFIRRQRPDLRLVAPSWRLDLDCAQGARILLGGNDYASIFYKASEVEIDSDIRCPVVEIPQGLCDWAKRWVAAHGRPIIGLSPFSISQTVKTPRESIVEFVRTVARSDIRVVHFGGPDEPCFEALDARGLPFDRTAALIHELDAFVGCSSGNLSLALTHPDLPIVAVGTPYKAAPAACDYSNPCIEVATYSEAAEEVLRLLERSSVRK